MAYEEHEAKRSRVVVETPTARREEVQSEAVHVPERRGVSGGTVGVIVVLAVALVTILVLLLMSQQNNNSNLNADVAAQQPAPVPQTTIIQQPAPQQQPPVIIQQPATQPAPVIVNQPAPSGGSATSISNDANVQTAVDKALADDQTIASLGITATVLDGKVTLIGTVKSEAMKDQIEHLVRRVKGVKAVDNQISVLS